MKKIERRATIEELVRMLRDDAKEIVAICEELETARARAAESRPSWEMVCSRCGKKKPCFSCNVTGGQHAVTEALAAERWEDPVCEDCCDVECQAIFRSWPTGVTG